MPALVTVCAGGFCYGHWCSSDCPVSDPTGAALLWLGWRAGVPRRHLGRGLLGGSACDTEGASRTPNDGRSWGLALHEGLAGRGQLVHGPYLVGLPSAT